MPLSIADIKIGMGVYSPVHSVTGKVSKIVGSTVAIDWLVHAHVKKAMPLPRYVNLSKGEIIERDPYEVETERYLAEKALQEESEKIQRDNDETRMKELTKNMSTDDIAFLEDYYKNRYTAYA